VLKHCAVNLVNMFQEDGQYVPDEVDLLRRVDRVPGVLRLLDYFRCSDGYVLILERLEHGIDLFDYITQCGTLDNAEACRLFRRIVETLCHVRDADVVHRDVKDENVIVDLVTGDVKLIDFGSGARLHDGIYRDFDGLFIITVIIYIYIICASTEGLTKTVKMARLPVPSMSDRREEKTLVLEQFQYFVCY